MPNRRILITFLASLLILVLLAMPGCKPAPAPVKTPPAQPAAPGAPAALPAGDEVDNQEVLIVAAADPVLPVTTPLGAVRFQPDPGASATGQAGPGETALELSVKDAGGITWVLSVPSLALEAPQTITMTALTGLASDAIPGLLGGVVLEPDGLQLRLPARLSASGPGLHAHSLMFSGRQDGSQVDFALQDPDAEASTARISHFSSYFTSSPNGDALDQMHDQATRAYNQAAQEARALLKQPIQVPEPPSIPLECTDDASAKANNQALTAFVAQAQNPEQAMLSRLLTLKVQMVFTGSSEHDNIDNLDLRLINRQYKKVLLLMEQATGKEEKYQAVSQFAFETARQMQLLGADREASDAIITRVAAWNEQLLDEMLNDIASQHEYKKIETVLAIYRNLQRLQSDNRLEEVLQKLSNALAFEVQIHFDAGLTNEKWVTDSSVEVQFTQNSLDACEGDGNGAYTSITSEADQVEGPPYAVHVVVKDFDPCAGTVTVGFDRFGAENEIYSLEIDDEMKDMPMPLAQNSGNSLYSDYAANGMYMFPLQLKDGDINAAEQTLAQSKFGEVFGELTIKLVHTPK